MHSCVCKEARNKGPGLELPAVRQMLPLPCQSAWMHQASVAKDTVHVLLLLVQCPWATVLAGPD